jgi:hypothetical protein
MGWRLRTSLLLLALVPMVAACGGGGSSTGPSIDVSGTYRVNGSSTFTGRFTATAEVQQTGSHVGGTYRNSAGGTFRIDGSVSGTRFSGQLIGTNNPAVCDGDADFLPDGREGQGSFTCRAGGRVVDSGTFTTSRIG